MIQTKTTGLDGVFQKIDAIASTPKINCRSITQGYHSDGVSLGTIVSSQAKQGRDPWFLDGSESEQGMSIVRDLVNSWIDSHAESAMEAARRLANFMVDTVKRHIAEGRSVDGPMKPLSERYAAIKKFVFKAQNKPILERTGELLASIAPSVSMRGMR